MSYDRIKLIRSFDGDQEPDLPQRIASEVDWADKAQQTIEEAAKILEDAEKVHEAAKQEYKKQLRAVQELCAHSLYTYSPGFAEMDDSWPQCDVCGKYLNKEYRRS